VRDGPWRFRASSCRRTTGGCHCSSWSPARRYHRCGLTTNRADLLEPALAARPGRVDVAVEITLPDAPARERLLTLHGQTVPLALTDEGMTLVVRALDDLLDAAQAMTRTLLGVGVEPGDLPAGSALMAGPGRAWMAHGRRGIIMPRPSRYPD
jgi:hypothetical protein